MNERSWPLQPRWMFDLTFVGNVLLGTTVSRKTNDRTLLAWDLPTGGPKWEVPIPDSAQLTVSHDRTWVLASDASALRCFDLPTGQLLRTFEQRAHVVAALPGDVLLCLGNGALFALSVRTGQVEKLFFVGAAHEAAVDAVGERMACIVDKKTLVGFDLHARLRRFEAPAPYRDRVVFRSGHAELVMPDAPGGPLIADATTGATLAQLTGAQTQAYPQCAVSPNGRWLVTTHGDQPDNHAPYDDLCIRVWDLEARTLARTQGVGIHGPPSAMRINDAGVVEAVRADDRLYFGRYDP